MKENERKTSGVVTSNVRCTCGAPRGSDHGIACPAPRSDAPDTSDAPFVTRAVKCPTCGAEPDELCRIGEHRYLTIHSTRVAEQRPNDAPCETCARALGDPMGLYFCREHGTNVGPLHAQRPQEATTVEESELLRQLIDRYVSLGEARPVVESDFRRVITWARAHRPDNPLPGACGSDLTDRDAQHETSVCLLVAGHPESHYDPRTGTSWTDADHYTGSPGKRVDYAQATKRRGPER